MRRFWWMMALVIFALVPACGGDAEEVEPEKTPQEIAEERAPLAVETADELLGAVQAGDKTKILDMCFRDVTTVSDRLGLSEEEITEARVQQEAQLALFEAFWTDMVLSGAYVIEGWSGPEVTDIAPAEGQPGLVVYILQTDVEYVLNGEELTEEGKMVVVFNLDDDWFAQWPY